VIVTGLCEGFSPPADADSLAYHFAIPKLTIAAGHLLFIPRAFDGAVPLLPQMTYMMALNLGGEQAMTLWCAVSSWGLGAITYAVSRRWLSRNLSLVVALVVLTTPGVVYGAGTGQVETRTAMFVMLAAVAAVRARSEEHVGFAVLAGLGAGFFAASKYPGLLFIAVAGLLIVAQRRWLRSGAAFGISAVIGGAQWYVWNFWNTGDPVFPMLFGLVPYLQSVPWDENQHLFVRDHFMSAERAIPSNLWGFFIYPVLVTFDMFPVFEAGRTGLGPYTLLIAPFAVIGAWQRGRGAFKSLWFALAIISLGFYALWFFGGASQRIRHLLPIYPVIVTGLTISAAALLRTSQWRGPIIFAVAVTLLLQLAGQGVAAYKYVRYVTSTEGREEFLRQNVNFYSAAEWVNAHLLPSDKILVARRDLVYLIAPKVFYANTDTEARVDIRGETTDAARFWRQLRGQNITHLLAGPVIEGRTLGENEPGGLSVLAAKLIAADCATVLAKIPILTTVESRTLERRYPSSDTFEAIALDPPRCRFERDAPDTRLGSDILQAGAG
jgi:4-amino-4-deoxy-L-arabinose transferase-like glycosyltransferase